MAQQELQAMLEVLALPRPLPPLNCRCLLDMPPHLGAAAWLPTGGGVEGCDPACVFRCQRTSFRSQRYALPCGTKPLFDDSIEIFESLLLNRSHDMRAPIILHYQ